MKYNQLQVFKIMLLAGMFLLAGFTATAQQTTDGPFKRKVMSYNPKYTATMENLYWVDKDTLYVCAQFLGGKIALADIDFTDKDIRKTNQLVDGTKDNIYTLTLKPKKKRMSYVCGCVDGEPIGESKPSPHAVTLVEKSNDLAEFEFNKLKLDALTPESNKTSAGGDDVLNKVDTTSAKTDPGTPPQPDVAVTTTADDDFDSQLLTLINGIKDNYQSLKGKQLKNDQFDATVLLSGAVTTRIYYGLMHNAYLVVDFGEFNTLEDALPVYHHFADKIDASKKMPTMMIKQNEDVADISRTISWLPFDREGKLDPALKGKLRLTIELTKGSRYDKNYNHTDFYYVQLRFGW